jgi:hypothetical protein
MFFDRYKMETKEVAIKAFDGEKVTIRPLTYGETMQLQESYMKSDGEIDRGKLIESRSKVVAMGLVNPVITEQELSELAASAFDAIIEIANAIEDIGTSGNKKKA